MRKLILLIYAVILASLLTGCAALQLFSERSKETGAASEKVEESASPQPVATEAALSESENKKAAEAAPPTETPKNATLPSNISKDQLPAASDPPRTGLPAPIKASEAPKNQMGEQSGSEKILKEYMDSGQWLKDLAGPYIVDEWNLFADGDYENWRLEITAYKIFDFDGDGVSELWLEAFEDSVTWSWGMSGFYTVENGQVKNLIIGQQTGGSIGGDYIIMGYDNFTGRHVVVNTGFVGGFGGQLTYSSYYDYEFGRLTELISVENTFYIDEKEPREFMVDGEIVLEDDYWAVEERFVEPIDPFYYLHEE